MWSISHHQGSCSRLSTVRPPHPCGLSCGAAPLGRRPPPGLCTGSPVTGCIHGSGSRLPWSPMQPGRARTSSLGVPLLPLARSVGWVAPVCPTHGVLVLSCPPAALRVCGVLGLPAPVHRCACSVCCVACAASWASRLQFTGVPARCVVLRVRRPGPPGSCSPVCPLGVLCCVCGVLGLPAPVHRCACSVCCVACAASWASRLLFTGVPARCVVLRVRRPGPPGSCSPVCPLGVLCCVCGVLGLPAPVHRCARSVCCVACAVSWASRLLFTGVPAPCVVLRVRRPGPPGSCSPVCPLGVLCCVCGVLGLPAPVHRCARSVCCVACAASWASRLLFTGVPARCVVLRVRRPGPPGSCSPVCLLGVLCCVCGVLGLPAPVHRCARSVCCVACAASWASRLLFTGVPARCVVLRVRRPGPPGSSSPVCPLGVLCCVCGVLGLPAPVHRYARSVCCVACAASWASRLLFTGVPARCVVLRVRRPGPPCSCSPVRPLGVLCCVCGVLGLLAPVYRCARSVCCVAVWGAAAGRSLVHPDSGYRSWQGLGTLWAHTRPSGRRLFVAGRGWVPSGRALVHPDGSCSLPAGVGYPPGAHSSIRTAAGVRVLALCGRVGRAGLPGALWCASPFPLAALSFCFAWPPPGWGCPPLSCCPCRSSLPWRRALVVFLGLPLPASSCARASFVSPAWSLAALWWFLPPPPPFLCHGVFVAPAWCLGVVFFFFFVFFFFPFFSCAPPLPPAFSGFRPRVPWASALCVVCFVGLLPLGSPCACPSLVLFAWLVLAPRRLLPPPPPPPLFVSRFSSLPLGAVCRVLRCAVRPSVRCCAVLCSLGAAACCAVPSGAARCPGALCSAALRFAVFPRAVCFVVARGCVLLLAALLCAVCVPGCCSVRSLSSPLCAVLCFAVLVRLRCAVRVVLAVVGAWCCGVPWCGAGSGGPWLSAGGVFRCPCLAAWSVSLWLVWFAVVPCFPVSCSVVLCCRVVLCCCALLSCCGAVGACFALPWAVVLCCVVLLVGCAVFCLVVVSACCGALFLVLCVPCLLRSVRCGALLCWLWCLASLCRVLWRCAVVWCCAVVLCCRFAVLFVFGLPSCGPSWGACVVCAVVAASCSGVSLCVVVSPWAFCGVVVLLWCVVVSCCAVRCPVVSCVLCRVQRCRAALRCCVGLFVAWVWLYLLERPPLNFVKYFFLFFLCFFFFFSFEKKKK